MARQENIMAEIKDMMLKQNEIALQREITRAGTESADIERILQQLPINANTELSEESEQSKQELLEAIHQQRAYNELLQEECEEAFAKTVCERTGQKIRHVKATNHSSALTGFINTSGEELRIDQDISNVTADNWSIATAGVMNNVDFVTLHKSRPVYDVRRI